MKRIQPIAFIALLLLVAACSKKNEDMTPVQPGETVTYKDMVLKFSFKAPKAWTAESQPGKRTAYFSTPATETRFQKFTEGDYGAKIEVGAEEHKTMEDAANQFKQSMDNVNFTGPEHTTLAGLPALKVSYAQNDPDGLAGYRTFTEKDSIMTYFEAATFGAKRMAKYQPVFDLAEKSVVPAYVIRMTGGKMDSTAMAEMASEMKPSDNFSTYQGSGFSIDYPDNFNIRASGKGVLIKGDRNDATVQVDQLSNPAGSDLGKFADENSKKVYHGASVSNATINGQPAKVINYSFVSSAMSRAYFLSKGPNVYRITINWPRDLESAYRPPLEKAAMSFRLK